MATALKKLIIISREKYLFQSTLFIGTWNLWKCKFVPRTVLHFEKFLCTRLLKRQSVTPPPSLTKTVHCCPEKILIGLKFTVYKLTYLKKIRTSVWNMMMPSLTLTHNISKTIHFQTMVSMKTLPSIELRFQQYIG